MSTQSKPLLTLTEAAERTGINRDTWKKWVADKRIPFSQPTGPGGNLYVSATLVQRMIDAAAPTPDFSIPTPEVAARLRDFPEAGDPDGLIDSGPHITVVGEVRADVRSDRMEEFLDFVAEHPSRFRQPQIG